MQTEKSGRPQAMIAMSGGVDSSVAAYLMQQAGYDCMGVTMKLYENEDAGVPRGTPAARSSMWRMPAAWPMRWACRTMSLIIRMRFVSRSWRALPRPISTGRRRTPAWTATGI